MCIRCTVMFWRIRFTILSPVMEDLEKYKDALLAVLRNHTSLGNGKARQLLGWDEATYEQVKQALLAKGQVAQGRGRGGSISLVAVASSLARTGQEAHRPNVLS